MDMSHRLSTTVVAQQPASISAGSRVFSAQENVLCRLEETNITISLLGGRYATVGHLMTSEQSLLEGTRIWVPDADTAQVNASRPILKKETAATLDGDYRLYVYYLGAAGGGSGSASIGGSVR